MNPWGWPKRLLLEGVVALTLTLALGLAGCLPPPYREMPPAAPPSPPVAPPPAVSRPVMYVIANRLNLRACPGMDCPRISVLEHNEEVEKVGEAEDWFQVRVRRDGRLGWVSAKHLSPTPAPAVPEAPPLAPAPPPAAPAKPPEAAEKPAPPKPPVAEKPKPPAPLAIPKKKAEERPAKPPKVEAAEPPPKPKPPAEKAAPAEKPAPPPEKPAPAPEPEQPKKIRIM